MNTESDLARRAAVVRTVRELGHEPVAVEAAPARPLPDGQDLEEYCRSLVRGADALLLVVDDTVSEPMAAELDEAEESLGEERIFYYFSAGTKRDASATRLWSRAKGSNWVATFANDADLVSAVKRTIGSYIDDALARARSAEPEVVLEKRVTVDVGAFVSWRYSFGPGDRFSVDLHGDDRFYARVCTAADYAQLYRNHETGGMPFGSDRTAFHFEIKVERADDYYLALKRGMWHDDPVRVEVRWVRR